MRENRPYGSEGGEPQPNAASLPLCAPSKASNQSGGSPDQGNVTALYPEVTAFLVRERWGATRGESPVRSESELDSAKPVGENPGNYRTLVCTTAIPRSSVWISPWDRYRQLTLGAVTR